MRTSHVPSLSVSIGIDEESSESVPQLTSVVSDHPSLSSSVSALFPTPSESVSVSSDGSSGKASKSSIVPSLSSSVSTTSQVRSPSVSSGIDEEFNEWIGTSSDLSLDRHIGIESIN